MFFQSRRGVTKQDNAVTSNEKTSNAKKVRQIKKINEVKRNHEKTGKITVLKKPHKINKTKLNQMKIVFFIYYRAKRSVTTLIYSL